MTLTTRQPGSLTTALILLAAALIPFPPALPADVVSRTREKYIEAFEQLTGQAFAWK